MKVNKTYESLSNNPSVNTTQEGLTVIIHNSHKRILGQHIPTTYKLTINNKAEGFICVTDGSVKQGNASTAFFIHGRKSGSGRLYSSMPVDGCADHKTSYRAELVGILATLIALENITSTMTPIEKLTGTIWCNNKSVL